MSADKQHIDVTEHIYQVLVAAYATLDRQAGKLTMFKTLKRIKSGFPEITCRAGPARSQPLETREEGPGLFRHRRIQWCCRGDQRTPRTPPRYRIGFPQPRPLRLAVTDPLRPTQGTNQRTLKPEEPTMRRSRQRRRPNADSACGHIDRSDVDHRQMRKKDTQITTVLRTPE